MIRIVILLLTLSSSLIDLNLASPILLSKPNLTASDCTYFSFNFWFPILAMSTFLGFVWGFYRHISPFHGIYNIFCCCCRHCYCSDDSEKNDDNKHDESEAEVENLTNQNQKIIYPEEFLDTLSKLSDDSVLSIYLTPNPNLLTTKEKSTRATASEINPNYIKALLTQAKIYENVNKTHYALKDYEKVIRIVPSNQEAQASILRIKETLRENLASNQSMKRAILRCRSDNTNNEYGTFNSVYPPSFQKSLSID